LAYRRRYFPKFKLVFGITVKDTDPIRKSYRQLNDRTNENVENYPGKPKSRCSYSRYSPKHLFGWVAEKSIPCEHMQNPVYNARKIEKFRSMSGGFQTVLRTVARASEQRCWAAENLPAEDWRVAAVLSSTLGRESFDSPITSNVKQEIKLR
jgi:hypothetical protein